jgi:hypothetical protein
MTCTARKTQPPKRSNARNQPTTDG